MIPFDHPKENLYEACGLTDEFMSTVLTKLMKEMRGIRSSSYVQRIESLMGYETFRRAMSVYVYMFLRAMRKENPASVVCAEASDGDSESCWTPTFVDSEEVAP